MSFVWELPFFSHLVETSEYISQKSKSITIFLKKTHRSHQFASINLKPFVLFLINSPGSHCVGGCVKVEEEEWPIRALLSWLTNKYANKDTSQTSPLSKNDTNKGRITHKPYDHRFGASQQESSFAPSIFGERGRVNKVIRLSDGKSNNDQYSSRSGYWMPIPFVCRAVRFSPRITRQINSYY